MKTEKNAAYDEEIIMHRLFLPGEITERVNCCDRIETLRKHPVNPPLIADRPWETHVGYPCVLYSAATGVFRMWYHACKELADRLDPNAPLVDGFVMQYEMYLCYAESAEGLACPRVVFYPQIADLRCTGQDVIEMRPGELWMFISHGRPPTNLAGQHGTVHRSGDPEEPRWSRVDSARTFPVLSLAASGRWNWCNRWLAAKATA